ncbi:sigma-70 RNA polymerase sigma factor region 4 domain-containing protein [Enterococcus gallinarum]|uniref:sigma-70 family RNA polymerase sigma factor n=1 Tax=Enterococcus gallinarum TaxID=1353 RepID=UPI001F0D5FE5|nr:sigma-70 family RNA polymerase sigma factor [Enterococcus gallinarum]MDV7824390.1 sigma-70 family RNA polymerase sigma factor [Enterococcus gallinarum]MDV7872565.1 sigma-70 family RNA polymerase sigma factor [Enterococcus gallinarum]
MKEWHTLMASYERLFYKVLIRAGIFPSHPDFEDYLQELRLMLFERTRRYPDEGIFRNENEVNYLFGFLLWRVIDLQRKSNRQKQLIQAIASEQEETIDLKEDIDNHLLLMQFWAFLKPKERQMWLDWVNQEGSKQSRYYYRQKLRARWQQFIHEETTNSKK